MNRFMHRLLEHKFITAIVVIVAAITLWWWNGSRINYWPITNMTPPTGAVYKTGVVALGDSLTVGFGATKSTDRGYIGQLHLQTGWQIANRGVNGDTSSGAINRLQRDVLDERPRVMLLLLGGNDLLTKTPLEKTIANLENIITQVQAQGAVVVLVGIQPPYIGMPMGKAMRNLAKSKGCIYVPNILKDIFGTPSLMSDQIHPNDTGYGMMAEKVAKTAAPLVNRALSQGTVRQ